MSLFRSPGGRSPAVESPMSLFRDLHRRGDAKYLWSHQGHLLRAYHADHRTTANLALESPTGSGKTLVGLLIAEFRRRNNQQRVAYLCPTRQLCHQVKIQADQYGIPCSLLVGPQRDYDQSAFTSFQQANSIAVTTYSGLFNTNPRIDEPEVIIGDDVHASEGYIASLWTVELDRESMPGLFEQMVGVLHSAIPDDMRRRIESGATSRWEREAVDLVPGPAYSSKLDEISDVLDLCREGTSQAYAWSMLRGHLEACNLYLTPEKIQLRPLIPPTETHLPFANAHQRIFMSATIGDGGELERTTGISNIARIPSPPESEQHNTGRRLILFPDLFTEDDAPEAIRQSVCDADRVLLLAKNQSLIDDFKAEFGTEVRIIGAQEIEKDLSEFTSSEDPTVLALANRYDGIDLPGDTCRRVILDGLPGATDLQERFFLQRLGASSLLRDRIRTRLTQAVGRCTRDETDYALVLMLGRDLLKWCSSTSNTRGMNPALQAELTFGIENSVDRPLSDFQQIVHAFLGQTDEWLDAGNQAIVDLRNSIAIAEDAVAVALHKSVAHEISFVGAMWQRDFRRAYDEATAATEALAGGSELRPYRAFWHYASCAAAHCAWQQSGASHWEQNFHDHLNRALSTTISIQWLADLRKLWDSEPSTISTDSPIDTEQVSRLLEDWQFVGSRFQREVATVRTRIYSTEAKPFESGLKSLGSMLGFVAKSWPRENGAPDGAWRINTNKVVVFEAKSDEDPDEPISLTTVRQAKSHRDWLESKGELLPGDEVACVLVTPRTKVREDAHAVAQDLFYVPIEQIHALFDRCLPILTSIRARGRNITEEMLRELISTEYRNGHLTRSEIEDVLCRQNVRSLPLEG